jgi:soluble lytic murein transglycosylase
MILCKKHILVYGLCLLGMLLTPAYAQRQSSRLFYTQKSDNFTDFNLHENDRLIFNKIADSVKQQKWSQAFSLADSLQEKSFRDVTATYVLWKKFNAMDIFETKDEFTNLTEFIRKNAFLPGARDLRLKAENIYAHEHISYISAQKYFTLFPPIQPHIAIKVLLDKSIFIENEILSDVNKINLMSNFNQEIKNSWVKQDFNLEQEQIFINLFGQKLSEDDYLEKIERLLWEKKYSDAERLFQFIDTNHRILYTAIIEINKNPKYINHILRSVPQDLRDNELLLYSRVAYYNKKEDKNEIFKIFYRTPEKIFKRNLAWWHFRRKYAREFLKTNDYKKSYFIASTHKLTSGGEAFAEAEWLSGWIALRFLKQPEVAYQHFYVLYSNVNYPVSLSRASYWAGRALQEKDEKEKALYWYNISAEYPTYFYGQVGNYARYEILNKIRTEKDNKTSTNTHLPQKPEITEKDRETIINNKAVKLAYISSVLDDNLDNSRQLFGHSINQANTKGQVAVILNIVKSIEDERLTTLTTRQAVNKGVFFIEDLYPVLRLVNKENPNSHLIHAIIKQESGFHVSAVSRVGALGFMQIMPNTAQAISKNMGISYCPRRLHQDPKYNIMLGSFYISSLLKKFKGSEVLAIASYNAGPTAVNRWIRLFGDPRKYSDIKDIVDWVELITYAETRNYVQRIIENSIVYEYLLSNRN